jgi:hypothetical protein
LSSPTGRMQSCRATRGPASAGCVVAGGGGGGQKRGSGRGGTHLRRAEAWVLHSASSGRAGADTRASLSENNLCLRWPAVRRWKIKFFYVGLTLADPKWSNFRWTSFWPMEVILFSVGLPQSPEIIFLMSVLWKSIGNYFGRWKWIIFL